MEVHLRWTSPHHKETFEWRGKTPVSLGRTTMNHIALSAPTVSKQHARLEEEAGKLILIDLQSTNGTMVKGERITRAPLADGDEFEIGIFTLTVNYKAEQMPSLPPAAPAAADQTMVMMPSSEKMIRCPNCSREVSENDKTCPYCGELLKPSQPKPEAAKADATKSDEAKPAAEAQSDAAKPPAAAAETKTPEAKEAPPKPKPE